MPSDHDHCGRCEIKKRAAPFLCDKRRATQPTTASLVHHGPHPSPPHIKGHTTLATSVMVPSPLRATIRGWAMVRVRSRILDGGTFVAPPLACPPHSRWRATREQVRYPPRHPVATLSAPMQSSAACAHTICCTPSTSCMHAGGGIVNRRRSRVRQ